VKPGRVGRLAGLRTYDGKAIAVSVERDVNLRRAPAEVETAPAENVEDRQLESLGDGEGGHCIDHSAKSCHRIFDTWLKTMWTAGPTVP
jgi:hypothetical protein